jgi:RHS repeat-associated protein
VRVIEHLVAASSSVSEPSYAYRWTARYDGLGRRVLARTEWGWWNTEAKTFTPGLIGAGAGGPPTSGSIAALALSTRATVVEESFHDPLVEFLEIAVETRVITLGTSGPTEVVQSRTRAWKVHGPDANGAYGGLQGIGGLEAVYEERAVGTVAQAPSWTGVIDDYYGHIIATVAGEVVNETTLRYHETKAIGYGPAPDSPVHYLSEGASLTQSTAWRGKRQDITGYYYLGARYYEPSSARFLSTDPMGHGASMSLYDYAGGDPINFVDPTGRLQTSMRTQSVGERFGEAWEKLKAAPGKVSAGLSEGLIKLNTNPNLSAWYMQPVKWLGQFTIGFGGAGAMANPLMISGGVGATADAVDQLGTRVVLNAIGDGIVTSLQEARDNPVAASGSLFAGLGGSGLLGKLSTLGSRNVLAGTISQLDNLSLEGLIRSTPDLIESAREQLWSTYLNRVDEVSGGLGLNKKQQQIIGPAASIAIDPKTGILSDVFFNNQKGRLPESLHPILQQRLPDVPAGYIKTHGAGSHSEIYAVDQILKSSPGATLPEIQVLTIELKFGPNWGGIKLPCPDCNFVLNGVKYIGD